jgi:cytochrome b subunit of formate dehydrogenase
MARKLTTQWRLTFQFVVLFLTGVGMIVVGTLQSLPAVWSMGLFLTGVTGVAPPLVPTVKERYEDDFDERPVRRTRRVVIEDDDPPG